MSTRFANIRVTEEMVRSVGEPEFTESWHPVSHGRCIDVLNKVTKDANIKIAKEIETPSGEKRKGKQYSLSSDGNRLYGAWTIEEGKTKKMGEDTLFQCIIFRNSIDKSYSFGINGGTDAYICANLMIFGEFIEFRRHTSGLDNNELERVVTKGLDTLIPQIKAKQNWQRALRLIPLTVEQTKALAYDAIREKVISQKQIPVFNSLLFDSEHKDHKYNPEELYGWHGACTEIMRDLRLTGVYDKQNRLFNFINERFGDRLPVLN